MTARARTSRAAKAGPGRSRSPKAVTPMTMLARGLTVTLVVRDAAIGPACRALCSRNSPHAPVRPSA
jgi:hypothetical protein